MTIRKQSFILLVALMHCTKLGLGQRKQVSQDVYNITLHLKLQISNGSWTLDRLPFFIPGKCKDNELLFPSDQTDDWICDCVPDKKRRAGTPKSHNKSSDFTISGFIFHPTSDTCHEAFKKGPCNDGEYLILRRDKVIPECEKNPCSKDGQVSIKETCYELGKSDPCPQTEQLGVNTTTLVITCVKPSMTPEPKFGEEAKKDPRANLDFRSLPICAAGSRRAFNGTCHREE